MHQLQDENAASPHGGTNGSKELEAETLILIDVGYENPIAVCWSSASINRLPTRAHLHGYSSDICRTFFPPFLPKPSKTEGLPVKLQEKINVCRILFQKNSFDC